MLILTPRPFQCSILGEKHDIVYKPKVLTCMYLDLLIFQALVRNLDHTTPIARCQGRDV